jgi:membrane protein DedA with SNARE-associated domain
MALELGQKLPELFGTAVDAKLTFGYVVIFAAMVLENLFPPIPSDLIMPFWTSTFAVVNWPRYLWC